MHEREYRRIKVSIEAEYKRKLEALELVYSMSGKANVVGSAIPRVKGDLSQAVVQAIGLMNSDFNARNIEEAIKATNPTLSANLKRASVSNTLKRLEGREVEVVTAGSGKRGTTYRRRAMARSA